MLVTPSTKLSSAVVAVTPSTKFSSVVVAVTPSKRFSSAVVAVIPSKVFISEVVAVTPSIMFSSEVVAVTPSSIFSSAVSAVTPSSLLISVVVAVTPSNILTSDVVAVTPSNMFSSAVVTVAPSSMANSVVVTPLTVPVVAIFWLPKSGEILVPAIAADALTSALTIVSSFILALVTAESFILCVCIVWFCSSCAENNNCSLLSFKSAAFTDEPAVYVAFGLSTSVSRKIRILDGLFGISVSYTHLRAHET